jgi:hypothetical protein
VTQTFTWTAATAADWFTASHWSPSGPPTSNSIALIDRTTGPKVNAGSTVDNVGIVLAAKNAELVLNGGAVGAAATLTDATPSYFTHLRVPTSAAFYGDIGFGTGITNGRLGIDVTAGQALTLGSGSTVTATQGNGITLFYGTLTNNGTLDAAGGVLEAYSGSVNGTGLIDISHGGEFYSKVGIGGGQTVSFADQTGVLQLYNGATLAGPITNFQAGDVLVLAGMTATAATYNSATHMLEVTNQGSTVASFSLISSGGSLEFHTSFTEPGEVIDTVITSSDATRSWNGGIADWYVAGNWSSTPASPASFPLAGDTVSISSGEATISAADVAQYGTINNESIILTGSSAAPGTLLLHDDTIGPNATVSNVGTKQFGVLRVDGSVTLNGVIQSEGHNSALNIDLVGGATLVNNVGASVLSGTSGALNIKGSGTFVNNGVVLVQGAVVIGSGVTVTADTATYSGNNEMFRLQQGGKLTIDGAMVENNIEFADSTGHLTIDNLAQFDAAGSNNIISGFTGGDRIDLANTTVTSLSYNSTTSTLGLIDNGSTIGSLVVQTLDGFSAFHVKSDGEGGSLITYSPKVHVVTPALPVPLVASPGSTVALDSVMIQAFGTVPAAFSTLGLSYITAADLTAWNFSYWSPTADPSVTEWVVNGTTEGALLTNAFLPPNPPVASVAGTLIAGVTLDAGTEIASGAILDVPIGSDASTINAAFYIPTIDPNVASPTIYSGIVDPSDIVASAERFASHYVNVPNTNDCGWIGDDVAAAAGATMPYQNWSTDPDNNVGGGFWRVAYRGSDEINPVADWSSLVQPGDIVRMGWIGGGQHTTTVLAKNPDGSLRVYDNMDIVAGQSSSVIGIHDGTYWTDTIPASITIYRLDPNHQFLISGTDTGEYLQGSVYDNLFRPVGGNAAIVDGPGQDEIQGAAADLGGSTIEAWLRGDSIDITDLPSTGATQNYDATSGVLTVSNVASGTTLTVTLPTGLPYGFHLAPDEAGTGTLVTVACFASGTRLRTPSGDVPVEQLSVGDTLLTVSGVGLPIRWIGRRTVDLRRHPKPRDVQPVRIAAHAFGWRQPRRPVLVSPDHALYCDGVLIPVRYLIDGQQIAQLNRETVTYWHVELDRHDVILADGLPVESYLDTGDRSNFVNGGGAIALYPDFSSRVWEAAACAPLVVTGPKVDAARRLIAASVKSAALRRHASRR